MRHPSPVERPDLTLSRRSMLTGAVGGAGLAIGAGALGPAAPAHALAESSHVEQALSPLVDLARWYEEQHRRFRIPAMEQTVRGTLLAAFDGRPSMGDLPTPGIGVVLRRSTDEGETWTPLQTLHSDPIWSGGDPSLLVDRGTGRVFCFFTSSKDAGYGSSGTGNDPQDPGITQLDVAVSDDDGLTWTPRRITPEVKDPAWAGMFASSGAGTQLRHGPQAGRLLQQYVVRIDGGNFAVTAYSDDHGATWQHGEPVGPGADENKVSERSDGSVLLNVRVRGRRRQAVSTDGGASYSELVTVPEQIDPGCNGDLRRLFPDAEPDDPRARIQVLVNAADPSIRRNLTLRVSFDDGTTWPAAFVLDEEASAYSTTVPLGDGRLALLYEREGYTTISFRRVDVAALAPSPLALSLAADLSLPAGSTAEVTVSLTNTGRTTAKGVAVEITGPDGIASARADAPAVPAGRSREVTVALTVPDGLAGARDLQLRSTASVTGKIFATGGAVHGARPSALTITRPAGAADHAALELLPVIDAVYPDTDTPGPAGDLAVPWVRVRNSGNVPVTALSIGSDLGGTGAEIADLAPGAWTTVTARGALSRTLTAEDVASGEFAPTLTATGSAGDGDVTTAAELLPLDLAPRTS